MRIARIALSTTLAAAAFTVASPAEAAPGICKYYKVYDPVHGTVHTIDLTWCGL